MESPNLEEIKALLAQAAEAFKEFIQGLIGIERERKAIVAEAFKEADAKKIALVKNKIEHDFK